MRSTKRTKAVSALLLSALAVSAAAQEAKNAAPPPAQPDPIDGIVAEMRAAEERAKTFRLELRTAGQLPGGLEVTTKGVLHVLRGAQPALHTALEFSFADGLAGRMESAQTATGIVLFEDDPAFGELYLHIDAATVKDLEWAGTVLDRADLPGMADRRATAPLGSAMVADLRQKFELAPTDRKERNGERGSWLAGARRAGLDAQDPDVPLADRVELFVRDSDRALLEVRHLLADKVMQHIVVNRVEIDVEIPQTAFQVDGRGQRLTEVQKHKPMADQIDQILRQAEAKTADKPGDAPPQVRPSRR